MKFISKIFLVLLFLSLMIWVIYLPQIDQGVAVIKWFDYQIETYPSFLLICGVFVAILTFIFFYFVLLLINIPENLRKFFFARDNRKVIEQIFDSFIALQQKDLEKINKITNNISQIIKNNRAEEHLPLLKLILLSAIDSNQSNISEEVEFKIEQLSQELLEFKETRVVALRSLIKHRFNKGLYAETLKYSEQLATITSIDACQLQILITIYKKTSDIQKLEKLLSKAVANKILEQNQANTYIIELLEEMTRNAIENKQSAEAIRLIEKILKLSAINLYLIIDLCNLLIVENNNKTLHKIIEKVWKQTPSKRLLEILLEANEELYVDKKVKLLQSLLGESKEGDKKIDIMIAELYLKENLIEKTRSIAEKLIRDFTLDHDICKLMAKLELKSKSAPTIILQWIEKL